MFFSRKRGVNFVYLSPKKYIVKKGCRGVKNIYRGRAHFRRGCKVGGVSKSDILGCFRNTPKVTLRKYTQNRGAQIYHIFWGAFLRTPGVDSQLHVFVSTCTCSAFIALTVSLRRVQCEEKLPRCCGLTPTLAHKVCAHSGLA